MKYLLLLMILSQLHANPSDQNNTRSCMEILDEIESLEETKSYNIAANIATTLTGGILFWNVNKKENKKIRYLRIELSNCK